MQLLFVISLALLGACVCQAATTVHPHHSHHTHLPHTGHHTRVTHEPPEHDSYIFAYAPTTHKMYVRVGHKCYIATLTADERTKVHTDTGIKEIEVKLIQMLSIATNITGQTVDPKDAHVCTARSTQFYTIP